MDTHTTLTHLSQNVDRVLHHDPQLHAGGAHDLLRDGVEHVYVAGDRIVQFGNFFLQELFLLRAKLKV